MTKIRLLLIAILILSFALRVFEIDLNPPAVYGDEIAFAWNAYSVIKTGADEYGASYPLQFRSYDDYKAPVPVYLLIPFIKVLGLNALAIRLPISIAGMLTVLVTYLLTKHVLNKKVALVAAFLLAISPWHVHLSRGFFEATLALLPFLLGLYLFFINKGRKSYIFFSGFFLVLSMYTYFSPRILVPLFVIFLAFYARKYWNYWNRSLAFFFIAVILFFSLPIIKLSIVDKGLSRFQKLSGDQDIAIAKIVNQERNTSTLPTPIKEIVHNKGVIWLREVKNNYIEHFSPNFWYLYGDNSLRYFTGNMGMFYLIELPFLLLGIYTIAKKEKRTGVFILGWLLLAPIPAAIVGRSFALRSIAMLPAPMILTAYGLIVLYSKLKQISYAKLSAVVFVLIVAGFGFTLGRQLLTYYYEYPVYAATWWGWENKALVEYARSNNDKFDHIFITNFYSGSPMAYAFYTEYDPVLYRQAMNNPVAIGDRRLINMGKYYFGSLDIDPNRVQLGIVPPKSLYLARPEEPEGNIAVRSPSDGRVIFSVHIFP